MKPARSMTAISITILSSLVLGGAVLAQSDDAVMNATEPDAEMAADVNAEAVWSRPSDMEGVGVAYMRLVNGSAADDALLAASSPRAASVELHETTIEEGVASMAPVDSIPVPAGGETLLEPGGYHLMLLGLAEPLSEGATFELTLEFQTAGAITVTSEVLAMDASGPGDGLDVGVEETPAATTAAALPTRFTVDALDNFFQPATLEVPAGTEITVNLRNVGFEPHNIAFYTDSSTAALLAEGSLTSVIDPELEASVTFTTPAPGEYFFMCVIHPEMTGTLIVR